LTQVNGTAGIFLKIAARPTLAERGFKMRHTISLPTERQSAPAPVCMRGLLPPMVLIVDADEAEAARLALALQAGGYLTACVSSCEAARSVIAARRPDLIVSDVFLPGLCGLALLDLVQKRQLGIPVIALLSRRWAGGLDLAAGARSLGAAAVFCTEEVGQEPMLDVVSRVLRRAANDAEHAPAEAVALRA
jgi:DNA-binding NtrC family response regulator